MACKLRIPSRYARGGVSSLTSHEHQVLHALPAAGTLPQGHERVPWRGRGQPGAVARRYERGRLGAGEELRVRVEGYQGSSVVTFALIPAHVSCESPSGLYFPSESPLLCPGP